MQEQITLFSNKSSVESYNFYQVDYYYNTNILL